MIFFSSKKISRLGKVKNIFKRKKPSNRFTSAFEKLASKYGLPFGIFIALCIAVVLTFVSMTLYFISGTAKLDLSRPGYESARQQVKNSESTTQNFSASGPLNEKVINDFLGIYDKESRKLQQYSTFDQTILDDAQIGLTQQVAPSDGANP